MTNVTRNSQAFLRHSLTVAMVLCFVAGGWLLFKPALHPATAEASPGAAKAWSTKAIEDVKVGDLVLARDEHGAEVDWKPVKEVYRRTSKHLRHLTFRDARGQEQHFETTDEHPFWSVSAKKFVNAGDLKPGDLVTSADQRQGKPDLDHSSAIQTLTATHRDEHPNGITVYNFQVDDFHTYFVAARGATGPPVLVHNANLYHGTDIESAQDIVANGLNRDAASQLGGGDSFWAHPSSKFVKDFAQAAPAGGNPAIVKIHVPDELLTRLADEDLLIKTPDGVHEFLGDAWNYLNDYAQFSLLP